MGPVQASDPLTVEVVFATRERQELMQLSVPPGTTAAGAIELSGIRRLFPGDIDDGLQIGIWGRVCEPGQLLKDGDRVEIYRELQMDPREARRLLAEQGRSMNQGDAGSD